MLVQYFIENGGIMIENRASVTTEAQAQEGKNRVLNTEMMQRHNDTRYYVENPVMGKTTRAH